MKEETRQELKRLYETISTLQINHDYSEELDKAFQEVQDWISEDIQDGAKE